MQQRRYHGKHNEINRWGSSFSDQDQFMKSSGVNMFNLFFRTSNATLGQESQGKIFNFLKKYSRLVDFELPPGVYEKIVNTKTMNDMKKISVVTTDVTLKALLKTTSFWRLDEKSFSNILWGLNPVWDYMPKKVYFSRTFINKGPTDKHRVKCIIVSLLKQPTQPGISIFIYINPVVIKYFAIQKQYIWKEYTHLFGEN